LHIKLNLPIQLVLLVSMLVAHVFLMNRFESKMLENVTQQIRGSATQSLLALNAMMLNGSIKDPASRAIFLQKMSAQDGVEHFHLIRADAVRNQFGPGLEAERGADELDRLAATTKLEQAEITSQGKRALRVVMPFTARQEFHGTNCLQCHLVAEGTVLGTVSVTRDLEPEYIKLQKLGITLIIGQILLQLLLLFLIGWLIRRVTGSVVELEKVMHQARDSDDFSIRAPVCGEDEVGRISQVFNKLLAHIEDLHQHLAEKILMLEKYYNQTEEELRIGSAVMSSINEAHSASDFTVRLKVHSAKYYSGDLILVARTPSDCLHIILADAVGHGMVAAMNLLPLSQIFSEMSKKGFRISRIAEEINTKIHSLMPVDRFIGAVLVSIDFRNQVVEVWNGGVPAPMLVAMDGAILHKWPSHHLPLGILNDEAFVSDVEIFHYDKDCQLFLLSDGILEAESPQGEQFGGERVAQIFQRAEPDCRFDELMSALNHHLHDHAAHDDISLAMVDLSLIKGQEIAFEHNQKKHAQGASGSHWRFAISLGEDELKYLDTVPLLAQMVSKIHVTAEHHSALYVILSELFNNALDHGILQLDSTLKRGPEGFDEYLCLRENRLRSLGRGSIDIEIEKATIDGHAGVRIHVVDSGRGFNYAALPEDALTQAEQALHGRGIALIRTLVSKLEFAGRGNDVTAYYIC
jgi:serine phosphatase RsbU (regulator of sigma subunit)/anti-sigma regulatory factor (Ser/Thr protein kinase)